MARVLVKNEAGECVGAFDEKGFAKWKRGMQEKMGTLIGFAIGDKWVVDRRCDMRALPPGEHAAILLQKTPMPRHLKRPLQRYELWKPV